MIFQFYHLGPLCRSIRLNHKSMERFLISFNNVTFDCILNLDNQPFELMIGAIKHNFACIMHVMKGYQVELSELNYFELCKILNLTYSEDHFSSAKFMRFLDSHLPSEATPGLVDPSIVAYFRKDRLSKSDREEGFYFCGWLPHQGLNNGHAKNFDKTEALLGKIVADFCREHDISSKWTNDISKKLS